MSKRLLAVYAAFAIFILVLTPTVGASAGGETPTLHADAVADKTAAVYIIRLADDPVVAYDGGTGKLRPTRPGTGKKINPNSKKVRDYVGYLTGAQNAAASSVGATPFYNYTYAFNGFAAKLTGQQAAALADTPGVISVQEDYLRFPDTDNTPDFLGLTPKDGLHDSGVLGEGVIIGVIDTGIWPEHPSFSDQLDLSDPQGRSGKRNLAYGPPPAGWHGSCQSGERFSQQDCNNKLIGARYFKDGFTNNEIKLSNDYLSARDGDGHGTHTASTAGGNAGVSADIFGADLGTISGIAPRARVAMYKACWADAGCFGTDLTMAIDQAVADGVDVINYSIGGGGTALLTSDSISFLFAELAGVYIATSAGNSGPGAETVGTPAVVPWVTSVGASTQDRTFEGTVTLGDESMSMFFGASVTPGVGPLPLVDSADAGSELCIPGALNPAVVAGNIVLCLRGVIARVDKSLAVSLAGGTGMVLYNPTDTQELVTDNHHVPSVHINFTDGSAIKTYITGAVSPMGTITGGAVAGGVTSAGSTVAAFSSRGPNGGAFDIIKPDVTAPGVNILAGNSPTPFLGAPGQLFQAISGTSMSSPHVAGSFALLKELHPDWSPAMAKSALMTTARQNVLKEDGATADPFDMGAGHIVPTPAANPGLTYDAGFFDYIGFLCGNGDLPESFCTDPESPFFTDVIDPSDLNLASISIGELAGFQTITRTLTDVGGGGTYNLSVDTPAGIDVVVDPTSLTFGPGESKSYIVTFTTTSAPVDQWTFGSLTWSDGSYSVYSPIAVRPTALAAPGQVGANVAELGLNFDVTFGYGGVYTTSPEGLVAATTATDTVVDDPANDINVALGTGVGVNFHVLEISSGTTHARFALFDDFTDGEDDLDLYAFGPEMDGRFPQVGASGSGTSAEQIDLVDPSPGTYIVVVHGWQTDGPDSTYTLFSWLLDDLDAGNMSVIHTGGDATLGGTATVMVTWQAFPTPLGLDDLVEGTKYLGAVAHGDAGGTFARTLIFIDG